MKIHHLGLAVANIEDEIEHYRSIGGSDFTSIVDDTIQNVKIAFFMLGDIRYELVAPLAAGSPVDSWLKKKIRCYHTCFEVSNLSEKITFFQNNGSLLVLPPTKAIALDNRRVAFVLTRQGDLIELLDSANEH